MALTLAYRDRELREAIRLLEGTVEQLPDARLPLAALFYRLGDYKRSDEEARRYLERPHASQRRVAEEIARNATTRLAEQSHQYGSGDQGGQPQ